MDLLEKIKRKIKNHRYYRHGKNFSKYFLIGILWTFLNIFLMWLSIDILKFPTVYAASAVVVILFTGKFYVYRLVNLIENKFLKYTYTVIGFYIANIFLMWLFVDIMGWKAVISSTIIVYALFILRFIAFNLVGLIKE